MQFNGYMEASCTKPSPTPMPSLFDGLQNNAGPKRLVDGVMCNDRTCSLFHTIYTATIYLSRVTVSNFFF